MNKIRTLTSLLLICFGVMALPIVDVGANDDAERAALARLVQELESLEPLIVAASRAADPDARIRFQYDWLRDDLEIVQRGIEAHIDASPAEFDAFASLRGDYRR